MQLKRIIALKVIGLLALMTVAVSATYTFFTIRQHRTMTLNLWRTRASVLADGFRRQILWDDRLAIRQAMLSELQASDTLQYCILLKNNTPYVYSFERGVPAALLQLRPAATAQPLWEFQDQEGTVVYDLASIVDDSGTVLRLGLRRSAIDGKLQPLIASIILIGAITIGIGSYLAIRIARRTTREVDRLARAITNYGELNDEAGLAIDASTSEVSELITSFKQLASRKKTAELELAALNSQLELRVKERTAQLTAMNQELDSFAYSVSHDLRAPLRGVEGFSSALLEEYADKLDDTGRDYLSRIRKGCVRMGTLIDDLLKLSRISRKEPCRLPVDLSAMAEQVIAELRMAEPERTVTVTIDPGMTAIADPLLMRTVLENLLGNAWKFTRHTDEPLICFTAKRTDDGCIYAVTDNGAGFNMDYAGKLFLPFQRLHRSDEFEGTGIGLASVQRVIQMHGGKIWADGREGQGAALFFMLGETE